MEKTFISNVAKRFHFHYERLAPEFGYKTRIESAVEWDDVPESNRLLMIATVRELMREGFLDIKELDPEPYVWIDRGVEHRRAFIPLGWATPPNYNPYTFSPRSEYEQDRAKYPA